MCTAAVQGPGSVAEIKDSMKILVFIDILGNRCINVSACGQIKVVKLVKSSLEDLQLSICSNFFPFLYSKAF